MSNGSDAPEAADWRMYYVRDPGSYGPVPGRVVRLGEIDEFAKASFVLRLNDVGSFVIDADPQATGVMAAINDIPYPDVMRNVELVINGRTVFLGPIQGYERRLDSTHEQITLYGSDQNVFLAQRICLPDPTMGAPMYLSHDPDGPVWPGEAPGRPWNGAFQLNPGVGQDGDNFTGPAGQAITYYVYRNIGLSTGLIPGQPGATLYETARARLTVALPGPAIGANVTISARFQNLLELIQGIAIEAGEWPLAFQVQAWGLNVWQPADRGALFSPEIGNVKSYLGRWSVDDANTAYVAGQGEGRYRQVSITHGYGHAAQLIGSNGSLLGPTPPVYAELVRPPTFGRVETFRDRRDTDDWPTLAAAGVTDCRQGIRRPQALVAALDTPTQRYGVDYDLGDIVTVRFAGQDLKALVTALTFHLEPGQPPTVAPTLGTETAVAPLSFIRRLNDSNSRINQLERR